MKERILNALEILKKEYNNGGYTRTEYVDLLHELNHTIWNLDRFLLCDEIEPSEIQVLINSEIENL